MQRTTVWNWRSVMGAGARGAITGALCVLLAAEPALAQSGREHRGPTSAGRSSQSDAKVLHALDRFTFGPTPGEVAAVKAMGLDAWFEQQLNPGRIDDSELEARLAEFPAMRLSQLELISRYPDDQMLKRMMQRGMHLPSDPVEHAIYADQMTAIKMREEEKQDKTPKAAKGGAMDQGSMAATGEAQGSSAAAGSGGSPEEKAAPKAQDGGASQAHVDALFKDLDAMKVLNLPPDQRMQRVLAMNGREFAAFRDSLKGGELAQFNEGLTPEQREVFAALQNPGRMIGSEVLQERMLRDIYSQRQLEAVMTDFWLNHFNVYIRKNGNEPYLLPSFERDVIRPNALGRFEDLLVATAKSPAMLTYLDNWLSIGPDSQYARQGANIAARLDNPQARAKLKDRGLNENYGRELMELHTVGVNGGYTQKDVTEVSKVFTGWTLTPAAQGAEFVFDERKHEPGTKTVMGKQIHEDGMGEGLAVLHMLATSPSTANFISRKLAIRFVSDNPPQALVDRMAKSWMDSGGEIRTVLRTMFQSPEFWAPEAQKAKVKTPEEFVISSVRASGAQVVNAQALVFSLERLGMPLFGMQTPNGYSWKNEDWVSTGSLVSRMNFALVLAGDRVPGTRTDWTKLLGAVPAPRNAQDPSAAKGPDPDLALKEAKLERLILGQPASDKTRSTVLAQADDWTATAQAQRDFQGPNRGPAGAMIGGESSMPMPTPGTGAATRTVAMPQRNGPPPEDRQAAVMAGLLLGSPDFQRR